MSPPSVSGQTKPTVGGKSTLSSEARKETVEDGTGSRVAEAENEAGSNDDELDARAMPDDIVAEVVDDGLGISVEDSAVAELRTGSKGEGDSASANAEANAVEALVDISETEVVEAAAEEAVD